MSLRKVLLSLSLASTVGVIAAMMLGGTVLAYGKADQPLAQIEFSGNCTNPDFPFCAPPPDGVGTGGIWYWIEIDAGGTGDIAGAGCGHTVGGVGGPGGAGADSIKGEISWTYSTAEDAPANAQTFPGLQDPGDQYYLVTLPPDPTGSSEMFLIPTTTGHYSFSPIHGVTLQLQVAP